MKQVFQYIIQILEISKSKIGNSKKIFWIFPSAFLSFCLVFLFVQQGDDAKIDQIDQQIALLENHKTKLKMEIRKDKANAMRWQSQSGSSLEAKRAWQDVDIKEKKLQDIDLKLEELHQKKEQLLQKKNQ